jgi:hypothetical protein
MQRTNLYRALTRARTRSLAARMSTSHLKSLAETALRLNILDGGFHQALGWTARCCDHSMRDKLGDAVVLWYAS